MSSSELIQARVRWFSRVDPASAATTVFDATGLQLTGAAATTALAEADTLVLKAQLLPLASWRLDEDGAPVPTFGISRADIPD